MNNKEYALKYASAGLRVFPVYECDKNGVCACYKAKNCPRPAKHPRISNGLKGATTDTERISKWWDVWPNANIAIATGEQSGIFVVDIDLSDELPTPLDVFHYNDIDLDETLVSQTGSGGLHYIYKYPETGVYKNKTNILKNIDIRAEGGYIIVAPSIHASGNSYFFDIDDDFPVFSDLKSPPESILKLYKSNGEKNIVDNPSWSPDCEIPRYGLDALEACRELSDNYETWIRIGMAIHYTDPTAYGFSVWDWWSSLSDKYDPESVKKEWTNFSRRGHQSSSISTFETIFYHARENGWEDPDLEIGRKIAINIIESQQKKISQKIKDIRIPINIEPPKNLVPHGGLIRDIVDHILNTSIRPQPELAVGAAVSFISALSGQKYQTETGLRTNIYSIGISESGTGKDHARKIIKQLAYDAKATDYIGGEDFASGQAIISAIERHASQLFMIDEFGMKMQQATDKKASTHVKDIITTLLILYSSAGSVYSGKEYADQKARPKVEIHNPNACLYGTSVPSEFYQSLKNAHSVNGTLSRFLIFEAKPGRPKRQRPNINFKPVELLKKLEELAKYWPSGGNLSEHLNAGDFKKDPMTVKMSDQIYKMWEELDDYCTEMMVCPVSNALYSRVAENASKLSLIYAISENFKQPEITEDGLYWGAEVALWTANTLLNKSNEMISENTQESNTKKVLSIIKLSGENGCSKSELTRKSQNLRRNERTDIINSLIESEQIIQSLDSSSKKPQTKYFYISK